MIQKIIKKNSIWHHIAVLSGGTLVSRVLTTVASPFLTRIYTPMDFGVLSIFSSLLSFMILISAFNYESAIPLPVDDNSALNLLGLSFIILLTVSIVTFALVFLFGRQIVEFFNASILEPFLWLLPLSLIAGGTFEILNNWAVRVKAFASLAKRRLLQSVCQVITQLGFPFFIQGPVGLLVGDTVGRAGGSTILIRELYSYFRERMLQFSVPEMICVAKKYKVFPTFGIISVILHSGFGILPPLLISRLYGLHEAGLYSLVIFVYGAALSIIGLSMAQVYMAHASELAHKSPIEMKVLFFKISRSALIIGMIPFGLVLIFGSSIFSIVFGIKWVEAGIYSQILSLPYFIIFIVGPVYPTLKILEKQKLQVYADTLGIITLIFGMIGAHSIGLNARWSIFAYGLSIGFTYLLLYVFSFLEIKKYCRGSTSSAN